MGKLIDLTGKKYGALTVLQLDHSVTFIKLTKQDSGRYIYIARDKVVAVTLNTSGYYERPDGTMVLTSTGVFYIVKETPESVIGLLTKEG